MDYIKWIKDGLNKPGKTQSGLASAINRDPGSVSLLLKGERELKAREIPVIAEYLEIPLPDSKALPTVSDMRPLWDQHINLILRHALPKTAKEAMQAIRDETDAFFWPDVERKKYPDDEQIERYVKQLAARYRDQGKKS